jgi:hypothetical protein
MVWTCDSRGRWHTVLIEHHTLTLRRPKWRFWRDSTPLGRFVLRFDDPISTDAYALFKQWPRPTTQSDSKLALWVSLGEEAEDGILNGDLLQEDRAEKY